MERLFYSILFGALVGVGAALWLPPDKAAMLSEVWENVQARAQSVYPPRPQAVADDSDDMPLPGAPSSPTPTTRPLNWPGGRSDTPRSRLKQDPDVTPVGYDDPTPAGYPRTDAPGSAPTPPVKVTPPRQTSEKAADGSTPNWKYPRGDENTVRGVEFNKFEGAQILARVGPDVVLANEVLPTVNRMLAPYKSQMPKQQFENQRQILIQQMLARVIEVKTVLIDARRKIPKEAWPQIQKQIDERFESDRINGMLEEYGVSSRAELVSKLNEYGSSLDLEKRIFGEKTLCQQWMGQQIKRDDEITHEDCVAYYREHLADFEFPADARWEELMVRFSSFPNKGEAFRAVAAMGNQVLDGAKLEDIAKARSQGITAKKGGERDLTTQGSLQSEVLDKAIFSLPVGALSSILESEHGYHIIRVTERREAGRTPFEKAQVDIRKKIREERNQAQIKKYVARIREQTLVTTIFDEVKDGEKISTGPQSSERKPR